MKRSGVADLPLHGGHVPAWLAERMTKLGTAIVESILLHYGHAELLSRLSDLVDSTQQVGRMHTTGDPGFESHVPHPDFHIAHSRK